MEPHDNSNKCFYNKFVDEQKLISISDCKKRKKYWFYYITFTSFCYAAGGFPCFVGYNFEHNFAIGMFVGFLILVFIYVLFFIKMLILEKNNQVFSKKYYLFLLSIPLIVLSISSNISAIFTATFIPIDDVQFRVLFNPVIFLFIYSPLYFAYLVFIYYAFMKCFAKYLNSDVKA